MDLNQFIKAVHQNAVAHGWHDKERSDGTMRSLFHCELSKVMHNVTYLTCAAGLVLAWIKKRGMDPVKILLEKHEYNKSRSYRHGGKVC